MRHPILISLCLAGVTAVSACQKATDAEVDRAIEDVNVIDESNLNDVMLTVGDPNEAVVYFQRTAAQHPDRIDLKRGLAKSLRRRACRRPRSPARGCGAGSCRPRPR